MGARSQRHLSEIMGEDSQGEVADVTTHPHARIDVVNGTAVVAAKLAISGGEWNTHTKLRVNVTTDQVAAHDYDYTPGGIETPTQVATGMAAVLTAAASLVSSGSGGIVSVTAQAPSATLTLNHAQIIAV